MKNKVLKSYYLNNSNGYVQLVEEVLPNGKSHFLVGWNAIQSVDDPDWGYSVHSFDSLDEANIAYEAQYAIDKSWGNAI